MGGHVTRADLTYLRRADGTRFAVHGAGEAVPDDVDPGHVEQLVARGVLEAQETPAPEGDTSDGMTSAEGGRKAPRGRK